VFFFILQLLVPEATAVIICVRLWFRVFGEALSRQTYSWWYR